MVVPSMKDYFFQKLVFPKRAIISKPGVLINQVSRRYGGVKSRHRTLYVFEDILVKLQMNTIEEIGMDASRDLWYKIGKDVGVSYMALGGAKKVASKLLPQVVDYMFSGFKASGMSVANEISYSSFNLKLKGKDSVICRKTGICDFVAGIVAGVMGVLLGRNMESVSECGVSEKACRIVCSDKFERRYVPDVPDVSNSVVDIRKLDSCSRSGKFQSFSDLVKFKKIKIKEDGKTEFFGKTIMAVPVEFLEIVARHYEELGLMDLLEKSGTDSSEKIFSEIFGDLSLKEKMASFVIIYTALGWGVPFLEKEGDDISVKIALPLAKKIKLLFNASVGLGFLKNIFGSDVEVCSSRFSASRKLLFVKYKIRN